MAISIRIVFWRGVGLGTTLPQGLLKSVLRGSDIVPGVEQGCAADCMHVYYIYP